MSTKVYVTPYIKGPAPPPPTVHLTWDDCRLLFRLAVRRLTPRMQWRYCRPMFFLQVITLATFAATAIVFATLGSGATVLLFTIDAALVTALMIGAMGLAPATSIVNTTLHTWRGSNARSPSALLMRKPVARSGNLAVRFKTISRASGDSSDWKLSSPKGCRPAT